MLPQVSITASTRNTEVYEGENAKFTCDVSIDSTISWTKNGVDVTALDDRYGNVFRFNIRD